MLWQARSHTNKCLNLLAWKCQFTTVVLSGGNDGQPILWMCVGQLDVWWIGLIDIRDMYGSIIPLEDKGCRCMSVYSLVRALTSVFYYNIFTACKRSCGNVVFLHPSVSHSVHRGRGFLSLAPGGVHPLVTHPGHTHPWTPPSRRSTSGRYASYWNAFLFNIISVVEH